MFTQTIQKLNRIVSKIKNMEMKNYNLKGTHIMCLYYLGLYKDGLTTTQIVKKCDEDKAAVSRALAFLQENEYVYTTKDEDSGYNYLYFLTKAGKTITDEINVKINKALDKGGEGLTDEKRNLFYESLCLIQSNLERYIEETDNEYN